MRFKPVQKTRVQEQRELLPRGDGQWAGFSYVYQKINKASEKMGASPRHHLSGDHIKTMAVLGCGHEETMKAHLLWLRDNEWID